MALAAPPTVNGLFFGDGDVNRYSFLRPDTSGSTRGSVYIALDDVDPNKVYIALVVDEQTSDTVCGGSNAAYTGSVGWGNNRGTGACKKAIDSEYASFGISCNADGDNDVTTSDYSWHQATAYPRDPNTGLEVTLPTGQGQNSPNFRAEDYNWFSDTEGGTGDDVTPVLPPGGIESASSWSYNLNHVDQAVNWNLGSGIQNWKTPDVPFAAPDNDLLLEPNYPDEYRIDIDGDNIGTAGAVVGDGFLRNDPTDPSTDVFWEWALVYEFSFDASTCNGPIFISPGESHNSPAKDGLGENVSFPPPEQTDPLSDMGDAPESYGTTLAADGPRHAIVFGAGSGTLLLGSRRDADGDGFPSDNADGDDADVEDNDEDGVTAFPTPTSQIAAGDSYTVSVNVTNTTGATAELCGWMDFDLNGGAGDGIFNEDERACITVPATGNSAECTDNQDGTFTCDVTFTVPQDFSVNEASADEPTYARFRLGSNFSEVSSPTGAASNGEVEDYFVPASSMPVSLNSFESRLTGNTLSIEWTTASETFNVGFDIWAKVDDDWRQLTEQPILSKAVDAVTPGEYRARVSLKDIDPASIQGLALSSIETTGSQELYGTFEVGESYGEQALPEPIAWDVVRAERDAVMRDKGYEKRGGKWRAARRNGAAHSASDSSSFMEVLVSEPGMQRVTYEDLKALGMDLAGLRPNAIAVTLKGEAVARQIHPGRGKGLFGPGGYIDFWGVAPDFPDALYVSEYVYRIEINPEEALRAERQMSRVREGQQQALHPLRVNEDVGYSFVNATEDPWHAAMLMYPWGPRTYSASVSVDDALVAQEPGRVEVQLTAFSDFPKVDPDHRVRLLVNGQVVAEEDISGHRAVTLTAPVPVGVITSGSNTVAVELPGGTAAPFDIVTVDTVALWYPRQLKAMDDRLLVEDTLTDEGLQATGFTQSDLSAYARASDGALYELRVDASRNKGTWDATVPAISGRVGAQGVQYWVSTSSGLIRPELLGVAEREDLLGESADFLLIAHPAFLPDGDDPSHPLNRYISHRENQGWTIRTVGIDAIQNNYGGGMPLPDAVTGFLAAAEQAFEYTHVLLIGDDTYDYQDKLGLGSVSFVPTMYADTNLIHHSPSDGLMTDLDGDGLSDKAVGRWPVRTLSDLEVMVQKTLDWEDPVGGTRDDRTSVWVTDSKDPNVPSFQTQAERMIDTLQTPMAGDGGQAWPSENITRVFFDELEAAQGQSLAQTARNQLLEAISDGQTLTGFAGHGSPTAWTFQGLLSSRHVSDMDNEGQPTLITTLTCYTTYFVSPYTNTLAHRLMAGYRVGGDGKPIEGVANGAVAVHGAATLSGYSDNEALARTTLEHQLQDGDTLGEAIRRARQAAAAAGQVDTAVNWALLGDPTLTIEP